MFMPLWLERAWVGRWLRGVGSRSADPNDFTTESAERLLAEFRASPRPLERPVVVVSGWHALNVLPANIIANLSPLFRAEPARSGFLPHAFPTQTDFDAIARRMVERVRGRWPNEQPDRTVEVDAIAVSMGGLVCRYAASPRLMRSHPRLNLRRLFTIGTPHRGAWLADRIAVDRAARDMKPGSRFLSALDDELPRAEYELVCYARLYDEFVGATRSAPAGREPIWLSGPRVLSHLTIAQDRRILADIAARLRGEPEPPLARFIDRGPPPRD
ncbi:MAG: hypothetical protein KF768_11275 [Phycisphaeraceae bacterium]|nr:hypothetical protein [Phycisphaeraceae bacterium]